MAEVGGTAGLEAEVVAAMADALAVLNGSGNISPTASQSLTATLSTEYPRLTLLTMVAPSPDWFVGVSGLPLLNSDGHWLRAHEVHLYPWDAGTEDGSEFSLTNVATSPQGVITSIRGTGKFSTGRIASLSFALRSVSTTRSVAENTAAGVDIGAAVAATEHSGTVTYALGGTDAASFDVVAATGQLQTKAALDYETRSSYEVTVTGTDTDGSVTTTVAIEVTNVVEVSVEPGPSPVTEGGDVTFTLTRDAPLTDEFTVNVSVTETGSMLSGVLPSSATFEAGADTTSLTLTTEDDAPIEDPSTVTVAIEADTQYQVTKGAAAADVVVLDDLPRFVLNVGPAEVTEGGGGAVTVEITNGVTFMTAQTISLALGGTATADDFTLLNTSGVTLSAPYTITIAANERVAAAYITVVNDTLAEAAETLTITASHDGTDIATETMTLRASPLRLELSSLAASGGGRAMYPAFDPGTLHYAVGCGARVEGHGEWSIVVVGVPVFARCACADEEIREGVEGILVSPPDGHVDRLRLPGEGQVERLPGVGGVVPGTRFHDGAVADPEGHVRAGGSAPGKLVPVRDAGVVPGDLAAILERAVGRDRLAGVAARVAHVGLHGQALGDLLAGAGDRSREGGCPGRGLDLDLRDRDQRGDGPGHGLGDGDPVGAALFEGGEGVDAGHVPEGGEEGQPGARLLVPAVEGGDGGGDVVGEVPVAPQGIGDGDAAGAGPRERVPAGIQRDLRDRPREGHAVDALAAAVGGGHRDGDLADSLKRHLMAVGLVAVAVGRVDGDIGAALHGRGLDRRLRDSLAGNALVLLVVRRELPDVDAAEGEGRETRVDRVRHVVAVDLVIALIGDVHHVPVGPDTARAVVAASRTSTNSSSWRTEMRTPNCSCRRSRPTHGLTIQGRPVPYGSGALP